MEVFTVEGHIVFFGDKDPVARAKELVAYARRHIEKSNANLYRIFYYDCPPSEKVLYHPLLKKQVNLAKTPQYKWSITFFEELIHKRKVALRRGEELRTQNGYLLKPRNREEALRWKDSGQRPHRGRFLARYQPKRRSYANWARHRFTRSARNSQPDRHDNGRQRFRSGRETRKTNGN